jgi:hypothetical protein
MESHRPVCPIISGKLNRTSLGQPIGSSARKVYDGGRAASVAAERIVNITNHRWRPKIIARLGRHHHDDAGHGSNAEVPPYCTLTMLYCRPSNLTK